MTWYWIAWDVKPCYTYTCWTEWQQVVNSHPVCDLTIRQPDFDLPRQQWSLLNHKRTEERHCGACRKKWRLTDTDLCPCSETQTMFHIVESCPLTKLNSGLSRLHSADEDTVSSLTIWVSWTIVHDTHMRRRKLTTLLAIMKYMSRPKSAAVNDIDITNILGQKYRYRIDIGHDNIDPPLVAISATDVMH